MNGIVMTGLASSTFTSRTGLLLQEDTEQIWLLLRKRKGGLDARETNNSTTEDIFRKQG
jgi:hypothetical protein